jgi:hypothetical protein
MAGVLPENRQAAQLAHLKRVAAARTKLEAANAQMRKNHARGIDKALQRAATRFLAPGEKLYAPRVLDLVRWPYVESLKVIRDVPQVVRDAILEEDALCVWCRDAPSTTIDHVHPLNRGGSNHPLNLVGACGLCNYIKSDFLPSELGWVLRLPQRAFSLGAECLEASC